MSNQINVLKQKLVKVSTTVLPTVAGVFAVSACTCKMYEPKLPKQLQE